MNERIRELWDEAAKSTAAYPSGESNSWQTQVNFMDKFAELIVQECIDCINNTDKGGIFTAQSAGVVGAAHQRSIETIRQHFGVKK